MAKFEITGKAVIYTADGVKVVDSEVRRYFNTNASWCKFKYNYDEPHMLIGGARTLTTDNPYAQAAYRPEKIEQAVRYTQSKFFRLILDLMRLAQWELINDANSLMFDRYFHDCGFKSSPVDWNKPLDEQFYQICDFTPAMIQFTEARYHDDL